MQKDNVNCASHQLSGSWGITLLLLARRYGTFAWTFCLSAHVSSGDTRKWIGMLFGVVSGVGLRRGVLDFGGDRWRGRGSLGVNKMQKWRIDRLSTRVCEKLTVFPYMRYTVELYVKWYSQVQDWSGGWREIHLQKRKHATFLPYSGHWIAYYVLMCR